MQGLPKIKDATRELHMLRGLKGYKSPFRVIGTYRLVDDGIRPEATVIIRTEEEEMHEASTGVGPVDALANVLKKSLSSLFPFIEEVRLVDYSSKIHDSTLGTAAKVEVSIVFTDGESLWEVRAISENINMASFKALLDGFEYAITLKRGRSKRRLSTISKKP